MEFLKFWEFEFWSRLEFGGGWNFGNFWDLNFVGCNFWGFEFCG